MLLLKTEQHSCFYFVIIFGIYTRYHLLVDES